MHSRYQYSPTISMALSGTGVRILWALSLHDMLLRVTSDSVGYVTNLLGGLSSFVEIRQAGHLALHIGWRLTGLAMQQSDTVKYYTVQGVEVQTAVTLLEQVGIHRHTPPLRVSFSSDEDSDENSDDSMELSL